MNNGINCTNQLPNQMPNNLGSNNSNTAGQWTNGNVFPSNNGGTNASFSAAFDRWLQNMQSNLIPVAHPNDPNTVLETIPHPLHYHTFGSPSTSSNVVSQNRQHPRTATATSARPTLTAVMPVPPNWLFNMENCVMSLMTFNKYKIDVGTAEFRTIRSMLYPIRVESVEQIVNPDLWDRFVKTRTDMMRSKACDLNILGKLGLSEKELMRCAHLTVNFEKDPLLIPYSDNMALLYHCTRNQANVESILSQGLDERLGKDFRNLGRGIYFTDDPSKSIVYDGTGYIFIFAVLLGDCISVDHFTNQHAFVREPEKVAQQKRHFNDQFFDSIVARPGGYNEYVIYNRYQCCPIYQIKYDRNTFARAAQTIFHTSSQKLPPMAWIPSESNYALPIQDQTIKWPFFAVDVFTSMGVPPPSDDDEEVDNQVAQNTSQTSVDDNLATLMNLGFNDETKNKEILTKFNNVLDQAVNYYLENGNHAKGVAVNDTVVLEMLVNLGFFDEAKNREVLAKFDNDVDQAINYFLDNGEDADNANAENLDSSNGEDAGNVEIKEEYNAADSAVATTADEYGSDHSADEDLIVIIDDDSVCSSKEIDQAS